MNGQKKFLDMYNKSKCKRCCLITCGRRNEIKNMYLHGDWPKVERAPEPTLINWENLRIGACSRRMRICLSLLVASLLTIISFAVIILGKYYESESQQEYATVECGQIEPTPLEAYNDFIQPRELHAGLMHCFCYQKFLKIGLSVADYEFENDPKKRTFCKDWLENYSKTNAMIYGMAIAIVFINFVLKQILRALSNFERRHTKTEAIIASAFKMFVAQFINTGFIIMIVNADINF